MRIMPGENTPWVAAHGRPIYAVLMAPATYQSHHILQNINGAGEWYYRKYDFQGVEGPKIFRGF